MAPKNEWRKMQILLPIESRDEGLASRVSEWHGGQYTPTYALASTGSENLVSLSMIDTALDELLSTYRKLEGRKSGKKNLRDLLGELSSVRLFWHEHSAEEAGIEPGGYDRADYGLDEAEEADMIKKGTWSNPRKAMRGIR